MRIAFHAPMKPPDSTVPSGDREMARRLIEALERGGHEVTVASRFVSRDGAGDAARQARLAALGAKLGDRLVRRWRGAQAGERPGLWFTYHVYHKAPDLIGPAVAAALGIPYVIAEASHAPKQEGGRWDAGYRAAEAAIRGADAVIGLSSLDAACVTPLLADPARYHRLRPFTDTAPLAAAAARRADDRPATLRTFGIGTDAPVLLAVGMMRDGDKLASYRVLAAALARLRDVPWRLAVAGDGPARADVEAAFAPLAPRVVFAGALAPERLAPLYAAADLMAWPAVREAWGMALLEAQAAGLPVVAGRAGGVADIVRDRETGLLVGEGDGDALADATRALLAAPQRLEEMRAAALAVTAREHGIDAAARRLDSVLSGLRRADAA